MGERGRNNEHIYRAVDIALRIGFLSLLIVWCFYILRPLIVIVTWGMVIAVGVYPIHLKLTDILRGRERTSAVCISLLGIILLILPSMFFFNVTVGNVQGLARILEEGSIDISLPYERFMAIPVAGEYLYEALDFITDNIEDVFKGLKPQLRALAPRVVAMAAGTGVTLLKLVISIVTAGIFLVNADLAKRGANRVFSILVGEYVEEFPSMAAASIRSVVQGVLGIALIQAGFSAIGMIAAGVPGVGILSILVMVLSIMQLPPYLVLLPVAGYVFATSATLPAMIYLIWSILVGLIDNVLKPVLLGRGVDVPMLVVLLGAVGGMIGHGIIGLFIGPVVLVLGYKVLEAFIEKNRLDRKREGPQRSWEGGFQSSGREDS